MRLRKSTERRDKMRFPMNRELRYKLLEDERIMAAGLGTTVDMSSGGVAFNPMRIFPTARSSNFPSVGRHCWTTFVPCA